SHMKEAGLFFGEEGKAGTGGGAGGGQGVQFAKAAAAALNGRPITGLKGDLEAAGGETAKMEAAIGKVLGVRLAKG
ncbi:MAG: hypothetical protein AN484_26890, partial [Aphanizomenon flos-aquae WA102]